MLLLLLVQQLATYHMFPTMIVNGQLLKPLEKISTVMLSVCCGKEIPPVERHSGDIYQNRIEYHHNRCEDSLKAGMIIASSLTISVMPARVRGCLLLLLAVLEQLLMFSSYTFRSFFCSLVIEGLKYLCLCAVLG